MEEACMMHTRTDDLPCTGHLDTRVTRRHHPLPPRVSRPLAYLLLACVFSYGMLGTTLPTPLYVLYQEQYQFPSVLIPVIFAVYALGVLAALLVFGRVSDHFGRRPVLVAALLLACASTLLFVFAQNVAMLLAGRVLSGLGTGLLAGPATAGGARGARCRHGRSVAGVACCRAIRSVGTRSGAARVGRLPARRARRAPARGCAAGDGESTRPRARPATTCSSAALDPHH